MYNNIWCFTLGYRIQFYADFILIFPILIIFVGLLDGLLFLIFKCSWVISFVHFSLGE